MPKDDTVTRARARAAAAQAPSTARRVLGEVLALPSAVRESAAGVTSRVGSQTAPDQGSGFSGPMGEVERQIRATAAENGAGDLADLLVAVAQQESNLNPNNPGDYDQNGVSRSDGVFQENDGGRGKGLTVAQKRDVPASTKRAIAEFRTIQKANPDADPGQLAVLSQRPREDLRPGYRANVNRTIQNLKNKIGGAISAGQQAINKQFNGTYSAPVDGVLTTPYGGKQTYSAGKTSNIGSFNNGVDLATKAGTDVRAPVGGVVTRVYNAQLDDRQGQRNAEENSGWGGQVVIKGDDGKEHRLSHAQFGSIQVKPGQRVEQGQPTHKVGMTGNATGPHVDWERWSLDKSGKAVQSENALGSPMSTAAQAAKAYDQVLARLRASGSSGSSSTGAAGSGDYKGMPGARDAAFVYGRDEATPTPGDYKGVPGLRDAAFVKGRDEVAGPHLLSSGASSATGATTVAEPQPNPLLDYYTKLIPEDEAAARTARGKVVTIEAQINSTKQLIKDIENKTKGSDPKRLKEFQATLTALEGQPGTAATGQLGPAKEAAEEAEERLRKTKESAAASAQRSSEQGRSPSEIAADEAQIRNIDSQIKEREAKLANGGGTALERAQLEAQIIRDKAELGIKQEQLGLDRQRVGLEGVRVGQEGVRVGIDVAKAPFDIDETIARTGLVGAQAETARSILGPTLDQMRAELERYVALTPNEIAQGKADVELTRQRAVEISKLIGPRVQQALAAGKLDEASATKILQLLPYDIAKSKADVLLTEAQAGALKGEARGKNIEAEIKEDAFRRWKNLEGRIKANPDASDEQIDQWTAEAANTHADWALVQRANLDRKIAQSQQADQFKQRQIEQQGADTEQAAAAERGIADYMTANASQTNAFTNAVVAPRGAARRMAQALAAAPILGEKGLAGGLNAMNFGFPEYQAGLEAAKRFGGRVSAMEGRMPKEIRSAPTFTPPTSISGLRASSSGLSDVSNTVGTRSGADQAAAAPAAQAAAPAAEAPPAEGGQTIEVGTDVAPEAAVEGVPEEMAPEEAGPGVEEFMAPEEEEYAGGGGGQPWWQMPTGGGGGAPGMPGPGMPPPRAVPRPGQPYQPFVPNTLPPAGPPPQMGQMGPPPQSMAQMPPMGPPPQMRPPPAGGGGGDPMTIGGVPWWAMAANGAVKPSQNGHANGTGGGGVTGYGGEGGGMAPGWPWKTPAAASPARMATGTGGGLGAGSGSPGRWWLLNGGGQ